MSPELEQAIKERISLGHNKEQVTTELREAGYDEATIEQVYGAVTGEGPSMPVPPAGGGKLIGFGELVSNSFSLVKSQWKLFLVSSGYALLLFVVMAALFAGIVVAAGSSGMTAALLAIVLVIVGVLGIWALTFGFQRALLLRNEGQPYFSHVKWAVKNIGGLILVILYVQFATSLGYLLLVIPGIALAIYLSYAMLIRVTGEATGVMALVKSTEIVYNRWWGVVGRTLFVILVFLLCLAPLFIVAALLWGGMNVAGLATAGSINDVLFPALFGLIFLAGIIFVAFLVQCSMVLLYESLRDTAQPWSEDKHQKLYKWMRVAVVVGIIPTILFNGWDVYNEINNETPAGDFNSIFGPAGLELDGEVELSPEEKAEFEAFMEQFGEELGS